LNDWLQSIIKGVLNDWLQSIVKGVLLQLSSKRKEIYKQ
jgi:hypothetical protein